MLFLAASSFSTLWSVLKLLYFYVLTSGHNIIPCEIAQFWSFCKVNEHSYQKYIVNWRLGMSSHEISSSEDRYKKQVSLLPLLNETCLQQASNNIKLYLEHIFILLSAYIYFYCHVFRIPYALVESSLWKAI